jgi:hypothetical protein
MHQFWVEVRNIEYDDQVDRRDYAYEKVDNVLVIEAYALLVDVSIMNVSKRVYWQVYHKKEQKEQLIVQFSLYFFHSRPKLLKTCLMQYKLTFYNI